MTNTDVSLIKASEVYVPSAASVPVVNGDTITFSTSDGNPAFLFFSPDAVAAVSPAPESPFIVAAGKQARFTFTRSAPGAYSVFVAASASAASPAFPGRQSEELVLGTVESGDAPSFGTHERMTSGH